VYQSDAAEMTSTWPDELAITDAFCQSRYAQDNTLTYTMAVPMPKLTQYASDYRWPRIPRSLTEKWTILSQ
jgi:hypothetical protein